jgi:DNA-binding transcriptional ArsR family regulator
MTRQPALDVAVRAMGHPGRRAMLRLARDQERSASELAAAAELSPSAASPHLKLLRDAGLMRVRVDAKRRMYKVDLNRLAEVKAALDDMWGDRLGALKAHAETAQGGRKRGR